MIAADDGRTALPRRLMRSDQGFRVDLKRAGGVRRDVGAACVFEDGFLRAEQQATHLTSMVQIRLGNNRIEHGA